MSFDRLLDKQTVIYLYREIILCNQKGGKYLFLAVLGLCCFAWDFSSCFEQGLLVVHRLLIATASRCRAQALGTQASVLQHADSVVVFQGLSCSAACGIFLEQGPNPCPLHWQADSLPVSHQGSPRRTVLMQQPRWVSRELYWVQKANQNWLHTLCFHLYNIL